MLEFVEDVPNRRRFGDEDDLAHEGFEGGAGMIFLCGERVLDVDETDDVVDIIAVNGIARMALVERRGDEVVERAVKVAAGAEVEIK